MQESVIPTFEVKVVRPYTREDLPTSCYVIDEPDAWVSDALSREVRYWCSGQPVFIAAPTGSGKTSFLMSIWKHCCKVKPRRKVLLLVHRTAIATQQKLDLAKKTRSSWAEVTDPRALELIDAFEDVGIIVMTYQAFAARCHKMDLSQIEWVILDEAHWFYSDALFNPHLDMLLNKIPRLFKHAHRIYMTATPGAVLADICDAERENLEQCGLCTYPLCKARGRFLFYRFPPHFDRVNLSYFRRREEIADLIQSHPNDKFLIFTSMRETYDTSDAKAYCKILSDRGVTVSYLDRFSKGGDVWDTICAAEKFDTQVLVCTSVLDCGVNFHDPSLRHIVVETTDKTEFLQMIGRKRLSASESINVYIRVPSTASILSRLRDVSDSLGIIHEGFQVVDSQQYDHLIHRGWTDETPERRYMHLLNYLGDGKVFPKRTAYHCLRWQKATLEKLLEDTKALGDDSALPRLAHSWLEQPDLYDPSHWLDYNQTEQVRNDLYTFLESYLDLPMNKSSLSTFSQNVITLVNKLHKFPHDKSHARKHTALNRRFETLGLPYRVQQDKQAKQYVLRKEEVDSYAGK